MYCIFSAARVLGDVTRSLLEGDDFAAELTDCSVDLDPPRNPLTEELGSNHWTWRLTCGVCLEFFRDPIILPCGHSFCRGCILGIIDHVRIARACLEGEIVKFRCPECRHGIRVNTSHNRFTANITARAALEEWLYDFSARKSVDRAVQTDTPSHETKSTQMSQKKGVRRKESIFTMNKSQETEASQKSLTDLRTFSKIKSVSCKANQKRERTTSLSIPVLSASCFEVTSVRMLDCSMQTDGVSMSSGEISDYWGLYSQRKESPNPQSFWVSPESDISKFGWFFNHTLFAFCFTMFCTNNELDI